MLLYIREANTKSVDPASVRTLPWEERRTNLAAIELTLSPTISGHSTLPSTPHTSHFTSKASAALLIVAQDLCYVMINGIVKGAPAECTYPGNTRSTSSL